MPYIYPYNVRVMRIRILLLCLFIGSAARGQTLSALLDSARVYKESNPTKTIGFARKAYVLANGEQRTKEAGESAFILGVTNYLTGNRDDGLRWYMEADKQYELIRDTLGIIHVYNEMCILYLKQKKIPEATHTIDKAIGYARAINNPDQLATAYNNKGLVYMDTRRYDSAKIFFRIGYEYYKAIGSDRGMAYSLDYLSSASGENNEQDKALMYLKESIGLLAACGDKFGEAMGINNMGELLLRQERPREALAYFKESTVKSKAIKYLPLEDNTYVMQAECYRLLGDYRNAYEATQRHVALHEEIANENLLKTVEELSARYETGKKEQENRLLTEKNQLQATQLSRTKIITVAVMIISLLTIGVLFLFYNRYKLKQDARLKEEQLAGEKLRANAIVDAEENERQRLARELHDGIGQMLAATRRKIQTLAPDSGQVGNIDESIALLDESIKEVRQLSHDMMPPWLRNKSLVQAIEDLAIKITQTTAIKVHTEYTDTTSLQLGKMQVLMLYRSIQEMASNVLRHSGATTLNIEVVNHDTELSIMVYDNGKGFDKEQIMLGSSGIGLKNIASRIDYIGGQLEIDSHPGQGTTYNIYLPINKREL